MENSKASKKANSKNSAKTRKHGKKEKKKKYRKNLITVFTITILIVGIIIFALTTPIFSTEEIRVEGNNKISTETILSLSEITTGENLFKINKSHVISNIKSNKYIDKVTLTRKLPNTIILQVEERTVKYQINLINSYAYIDKNGYILENPTVKAEVPVIVGFEINENEMLNKERLEQNDLSKLNDISQIMEASESIQIDNLITEINTETKDDYILILESKNKRIYIGNTTNLTNKMLYVQKILQNEEGKSGIIFVNGDISAGFKPYFREDV